ncbi:MAG: sulfatase-like hydrolase/transferase [Kiritimatiellia bacterium]|nr:sulfatase-like hydrolase/transferase [Lentisphaerota bacterium]
MAARACNVLWFMTDQHRADCLGCMGHPAAQTPNIDRLAGKGIVFDQAFCQSPVCMASRAALLTGRYPAAVRVRGMGILPPTETTFPEVFHLAPLLYGELRGPYRAVQTLRTPAWKLNVYPDEGRQYGQLFDLHNDPGETRNLYNNGEYRNIREELLWRLLSRTHKNTDPLPLFLTQY